MVSLDPRNLYPIAANDMFERRMGPLRKFSNDDFIKKACSEDKAHADARDRFRSAIENVASGEAGRDGNRVRVRGIEMTTVTEENSGLPLHKHFDWFMSRSSGDDGAIILLGDPVSDQDVFQHEKEFRDDTVRKIRDARAGLLLEETKRSLKMLDNFMAQTLHHLR
jgi:hypothetical protein